MLEVAGSTLQERDEKRVGFIGIHFHPPVIQSEEDVGREERDALVSVDEGMIHQERFEQRRRHRGNVVVIAGLRSEEGAFEETAILQSRRSSESLDETLVNRDDFVGR